MKKCAPFIIACLALLTLPSVVLYGQEPVEEDYYTLSGVVRNKDNRRKLENVSISVSGSNIGTVTNADGVFSLKIKKSFEARELKASHVGFLNSQIPVDGQDTAELTIYMIPAPNLLREVVVYGDPRTIVEEALKKIPENYSVLPNMLTGFYRETVRKGSRYISVAEAVIDIYKTSYTERTPDRDRVQIMRGRRLISQKRSDTLAVKVIGGPNISIYLDVVKNEYTLLDAESLYQYEYKMEEPVALDNRTQYVVSFRPAVITPYALNHGKFYIDYETLTFTRAEFEMDMKDRLKATAAILHKKPLGLRFRPQEVSYLVTYKTVNGKSYLNYIRNEMRFRCDWKRRLFSSGYTVLTEMVVTDHHSDVQEKIAYRDAFKQRQVFYDIANQYWDEDFWKAYNIIEPTESLEHAVNRLKKAVQK
ncbi:MAG: carboxypeptidase-like regulatory domain-containing protein [Mediterranea sp.]|jgi:hypothetical protein|nr:carboxypeptidase-like regulatory domain-containing protein [Mediterranea sp.]